MSNQKGIDELKVPNHVPVMLREVLELLVPPKEDCLMIDGTLGLGGHSSKFLSMYPGLHLTGVDADKEVQEIAKERLSTYKDRITFVNSFFDDFFASYKESVKNGTAERAGIILFDFGISMFHFREAGRGFSMQDQTLDMRLSSNLTTTAASIVNTYDVHDLCSLISDYGEEPFAWNIARSIVKERDASPIESGIRLADIVKGAVPAKVRYGHIHPATRTFQALRIAVNNELFRLERGLDNAIDCLSQDGVIACISFHSLEDRIVKRIFKERSIEKRSINKYAKTENLIPSVNEPISETEDKRILVLKTGKPVEAKTDELELNPASRSAKLRVAYCKKLA